MIAEIFLNSLGHIPKKRSILSAESLKMLHMIRQNAIKAKKNFLKMCSSLKRVYTWWQRSLFVPHIYSTYLANGI